MKENSSKNPGRRIGPLNEFIWWVYEAGYMWCRSRSPEQRWAITSGVDEETESQHSKAYEPLKQEPGLFRAFADVVPHREEILAFVNQYGLLGGRLTGQWEFTDSEGPSSLTRTELLRDWMIEILFMREMVQLWNAVQGRDEKSIRRRIRWIDDAALFENSRDESLSLPTTWAEPLAMILDPDHSSLRMRGWVVLPGRDGSEWVEYLRSEWIATALYFLRAIVNRKLADHEIGRPTLQYRGHERLEWQHLPSSLLGALWLQFADAIAANRSFNQCLFCKRWFDVAADGSRRDKHYCSQTCRTGAYRTRRIEAQRLHALGSTVEELAERFGSDPATIRGWLAAVRP
jgi:hypothetical protein